jgi:hypothetical protein
MKKINLLMLMMLFSAINYAQENNLVLIEEFTETGCGACAQYDSSFQAFTRTNADKVAVINYHCFYSDDPFFQYNKACNERQTFYHLREGFPAAIVNGKRPGRTSEHLHYAMDADLIDKWYHQPPNFRFDITSKRSAKNHAHTAELRIKITALKDSLPSTLKMFVAVTENNINYKERFHAPSPNGINDFNHIFRKMLPGNEGIEMDQQVNGKVNSAKIIYTNDDATIDFRFVQFVVYVQDMNTKEVLGTIIVNENPFKLQ